MAIQPTNPITVPSKVADSLWITSLNIIAPDATRPIRVQMLVAPFISSTGEILKDMQKPVVISNLDTEAAGNPLVAAAVAAIYAAVENLVKTKGVF